MLFIPDGNLIDMHGTTANMYPTYLENGTWNNEVPRISMPQLKKVKIIFNKIINCNNKQIEMAIDRLIRALIRENKEDAFLDILIGIEILLTDIFSKILKAIILDDALINSKDIPQEIDNMIIKMFSK